ncbi:MAG: hypothetical protein CM1200mP35_04540 [Chloroflexota bacterium]|nr:MAG: hypothetical protein CM1200mP35_04540 [Chloroflexota bacterium]
MHAVVRNYSGSEASQLFSELEGLLAGIEEAIRSIPGVVTYTLIRTSNGGTSITVCDTKDAADESVRVAAEFIGQHCSTRANPPDVTEGGTLIHIQA